MLTKTINIKRLLSISLAILIAGCAKQSGFDASEPASVGDGGSGGGSPGDNSGSDLKMVDLSGTVIEGQYSGQQLISFDKNTGILKIMTPIILASDFSLDFTYLPSMPGSSLKIETGANNTIYFVVSIPVRYILKDRGVWSEKAKTLPNGDPLPFIGGGDALPFFSFPRTPSTVPTTDRKTYIYVGVEAVGIFVETNWSVPFTLRNAISNASKTAYIGYLENVPRKDTFRGGLFLSLRLPREISLVLAKYFE